MKTSFLATSLTILGGSIALASAISASAFADPMLVMDHNARMGPKYEALIECVQAAHRSPDLNVGQMFSPRVLVANGPNVGSKTYILSGSAWENGVRVPITAKCVTNNAGSAVASVSRVHKPTSVATAGR